MIVTSRTLMQSVVFLCLATAFSISGCRKEEPEAAYPQQQQAYPPQQQYPQQQQQQYPQAQGTETLPPGGAPCQSDADIACLFGRCINGQCGTCTVNEHCKQGSTCVATPLGQRCVPAGMPGTQPTQTTQ